MAGRDRKRAQRVKLVADKTRFFGREEELARLDSWLASGGSLATLVGPPGIGKTRLARQLCGLADSGFEIVFCDLTDARSREDVVVAVARALAVPLIAAAVPSEDQVAGALAALDAPLVVLDNFEQVLEVARGVLARWCEEAPGARFLVTSREPLDLDGELRVPLAPLSDDESVGLLEDRVASARGGANLGADERAELSVLAGRLDRLPLALELAAARAELLTVPELRARLDDRFELLAFEGSKRKGRHGTLRAALDWSWELLSIAEQKALAQCAVFVGSFSVRAAESVLETGPGSPSALDLLQSLRRKSLLRIDEDVRVERLGLLESIRELAKGRLEVDVRARAEQRHAEFYATEAERLVGEARGADAASAYARLGEMRENLVAGYERSRAIRAALACRLALALDELHAARGPGTERRPLLDGALACARAAGDVGLATRALLSRGHEALTRGDARAAQADFVAALEQASCVNAQALAGEAKLGLALLHQRRFEADLACAEAEAAIELFRAAGARALEAEGASLLGDLYRTFHRREEAEVFLEKAIVVQRELGDWRAEVQTAQRLGVLHGQRGRTPLARACLERALELQQKSGSKVGETMLLANLSRACREADDLELGQDYLVRALASAVAVGDRWGEARVLQHFGMLLVALDRIDESIAMLRTARERLSHGEFPRRLGDLLLDLGRVCIVAGELAEAESELLRAVRVAREAKDALVEGVALANLAALLAHRGSVAEASRCMEEARERLALDPDQRTPVVLSILEAEIDRARAHEARLRGAEDEALRWTESAAARRATEGKGTEVRLAKRIASVLSASATEPATSTLKSRAAALEAERTGRWFRPRGAIRTSLGRRPSLHRVFAVLLDRRLSAPGEPLSWERLLEAGWPGERVLRNAGKNRVQVAVRTLRRLGLEPTLRTREEGYFLDPAIELELH